jgi:uncharacterized repeat protein (TIGR02543 family)
VGGVLGLCQQTGVTLLDSYNRGDVKCTATTGTNNFAGGVVGNCSSGSMTIQNCYSTGSVEGLTANVKRGCFAGYVGGTGNMKNNHAYKVSYKFLSSTRYLTAWGLTDGSADSGVVTLYDAVQEMAELTAALGTSYGEDSGGLNGGYPVLTWQQSFQPPAAAQELTLTENADGTYTLANITDDVTVYIGVAKRTYTVRFVTEQGGADAQAVVYLDTARDPNLTADNYRLEGWYTDGAFTQSYDFDTPVTGDLTLYAKWVFQYYVITFWDPYSGYRMEQRVGGADWPEDAPWVASPPEEEPQRAGYRFTGWYTELGCRNLYPFGGTVTQDRTLYAGWTAGEYTLTIDPDNGE